jgi:hypothetical protein
MKRLTIAAAMFVPLALVSPVQAEDWKPAAGPLMTRWAKEVSPDNVHAEYPRPQMVRPDWLNLNGLWQLDDAEVADPVPTGKDLPKRILVPFPIESALSGVMARAERICYRRTFNIPEKWKGRRVLLHFQAVDWEATVYVNGRQLVTHRGGYDAFSCDVTDALKSGGDQELIVKVFDPSSSGNQPRGKQVDKPRGIWYTPSTGIWQTVWLEPVPAARIGQINLVPDPDASCLRLIVEGIGTGPQNTVEAVARDGQQEVARATGGVGKQLSLTIPARSLKLWSPDEPFLYDLTVTLKQGDVKVDEVESYFGMRKIELAKDEAGFTRLRLNGEFLFQIGPLDQGFWPDGLYAAPTDEALRYDIEVTKRLGFNMARKHVKIEPDRWYYWCDKLGLLVWQDMPSGNNRTPESKKQFETELRRLIAGRRNHPSIIVWVVFNEGWGQHDTGHYVEMIRKIDPTRLITGASGWKDEKVGDINDIHNYKQPAAPPPEPNRAGVLGEFGGIRLAIKGHTWTEKTWGYRRVETAQDLTRRYQSMLRGVWEFKQSQGMSAAVYTQTTDVETECNGLMTYDRAIIKPEVKKVAAANRGVVPKLKTVVPTSQTKGIPWRYTLTRPADAWLESGFDDSPWEEGRGGFGTEMTPGAVVRTKWKTPQIWLRREFQLPDARTDEDVEIYLNGVLAAKAARHTTSYEELPIAAAARAALRPGKNVLAVHCKQTQGGQYIDVGIVELVMPKP